MRRGDVYWINLEPASPPEMGKVQPAVVVSSTIYNERLATVVVVPLSGRPPAIWPLRLEVKVPRMKASFAVVPAMRQVAKARLHERIGRADEPFLERLDEAVALYLSE